MNSNYIHKILKNVGGGREKVDNLAASLMTNAGQNGHTSQPGYSPHYDQVKGKMINVPVPKGKSAVYKGNHTSATHSVAISPAKSGSLHSHSNHSKNVMNTSPNCHTQNNKTDLLQVPNTNTYVPHSLGSRSNSSKAISRKTATLITDSDYMRKKYNDTNNLENSFTTHSPSFSTYNHHSFVNGNSGLNSFNSFPAGKIAGGMNFLNMKDKSKTNPSNNPNQSVGDHDSDYLLGSTKSSSPSLVYTGSNSNNSSSLNQNKKSTIDKYYEYIGGSSNRSNMTLSNSNSHRSSHSSNNSPSTKSSFYINLEDLMVLEEKLYEILENFRASKPSSRNCFEWWNFYNYCSLGGKFEYYFKEEIHKKIVRDSCALEFISIIISFEASNDTKVLTTTINILKNLLYLIHQNFLIICDYLLSKVSSDSYSNVWVNKIQNLILTKMNKRLKKGENVVLLKHNNDNIFASFKNIFRIYSPTTNTSNKQLQTDFSTLIYFVKNLSKIAIKTLNEHFKNKVLRFYGGGSTGNFKLPDNFIIEEGESLPSIPVPYLNKYVKNGKVFTLVLDLDETLIHFKINPDNNKGILRLRPGLHEFLDSVNKMFELVVFTAATQDYADPILDAIEASDKFFDYRLYRQHAIIIENDFVKDLSKLGRDLSKVIIVDNMPQNFKLQKDNGIFIKTFYGEDADDTALIDLTDILMKLTNNSDNNTDLRKELKKYRNEIFRKITTDMDRSQNNNSEKTRDSYSNGVNDNQEDV